MRIFKKMITMLLTLALILSCIPVDTANAAGDGSVAYQTVGSVDELQKYIDSDGAYSSQDTIVTKWSGTGSAHKITVDEDGWLFLKNYSSTSNYINCNLYSNFALTNRLATDRDLVAVYVPAGSYYYQASRWNGADPIVNTVYVGFMPASSRIKVKKITYSNDKSLATVTFNLNEDYFSSFLETPVRVVKKAVSYTDIKSKTVWNTSTRENAIEKNSFKATSNGTYTALVSSSDDYFCMVSFKITGLKTTKPAAPKITSYKKGSKIVEGTALAYGKVTVTVNSKSYTTTANSKGVWSITVKSSLKKGNRITTTVKNAAGTKSKSTSKVVN